LALLTWVGPTDGSGASYRGAGIKLLSSRGSSASKSMVSTTFPFTGLPFRAAALLTALRLSLLVLVDSTSSFAFRLATLDNLVSQFRFSVLFPDILPDIKLLPAWEPSRYFWS